MASGAAVSTRVSVVKSVIFTFMEQVAQAFSPVAHARKTRPSGLILLGQQAAFHAKPIAFSAKIFAVQAQQKAVDRVGQQNI
ncbi:hypothetical protein LXM94_04890 [Rhizobium sp. TRM95111]|uniref:hypothetical protein n=1 Tax=Rhizobium alarense TaxID=2846851 RepID=UPI001F460ECF|nr:hypothetical protein [Rhizobium alarense]MCF3639298.1 hypothetical protein [Rhizobium alarense]